MEKESITIVLPVSLIKKIEDKIRDSSYRTLSEYIADVLNEVLKAEEMELDLVSEEQRAAQRKKLQDLGYLE